MRSGGRSSIPKQSSRSRSAGACQQKIHFLHASFRYARIEDDSKFLATHRQVVELLQKPKISDTPRIKKKKKKKKVFLSLSSQQIQAVIPSVPPTISKGNEEKRNCSVVVWEPKNHAPN